MTAENATGVVRWGGALYASMRPRPMTAENQRNIEYELAGSWTLQ